MFLTNSWRIAPDEADHTLVVTTGIVLVSGGGDPFVDTAGAYTVRINYQQPVQAITVATGGTVAPSAAEMRAAMGLAAANLDTQIDALPTATDNAAAVLSAAQTTPIHSDFRKAIGQDYHGDGSEGDKLRSTLVP